jgi:hypothetical protein
LKKLLIFGFIVTFLSCDFSKKRAEPKIDKKMFGLFEKKTKKKTEILSHADYNIIFDNKIVEETPIEKLEIGKLNLPTGKIVICDPLVYSETAPLTKKVKPGLYPIKIYIAKTKDSGDRYAIAKLEFSNKKSNKWVMATKAEDDLSELTDEADYFGFPVDAGLGAFFDYQTGKEYQKFESDFMKLNSEGNIYDDFFAAEFKKKCKRPK